MIALFFKPLLTSGAAAPLGFAYYGHADLSNAITVVHSSLNLAFVLRVFAPSVPAVKKDRIRKVVRNL